MKEGKLREINKNISRLMDKIKNNIAAKEISEEERFLEELKQAHEEWQRSEQYFQNVTEPDLIDYAIHKIEASKTKYIFLLKQAREKRIKAENVNSSL